MNIYICWNCKRVLSEEEYAETEGTCCSMGPEDKGIPMEKIEVLEIEAVAFNEESFR